MRKWPLNSRFAYNRKVEQKIFHTVLCTSSESSNCLLTQATFEVRECVQPNSLPRLNRMLSSYRTSPACSEHPQTTLHVLARHHRYNGKMGIHTFHDIESPHHIFSLNLRHFSD